MVSLVGTLATNPELRRGDSGIAECWLRLAVSRHARSGRREPGVVYVHAVTSGIDAPDYAKRLSIGHRIAISGRLEPDDRERRSPARVAEPLIVAIDQLDLFGPSRT